MRPSIDSAKDTAAALYILDGLPGLEARQIFQTTWGQRIKRWIDILLVVSGALPAFPLILFIAVAVRLDSPGSSFYTQPRVGKGGRRFRLWKFRTMVANADQILEGYLSANPAARCEWETAHKIKQDPRITRLGKFLRQTSLDELPQLWNILAGEMSMVGPRPIVDEEIEHYREGFKLYTQVRPGLTGLWQVSGRNDLDYSERVRLDEYYVLHWSVWLDITILVRTVLAVLQRNGAY